MTVFRFVTLDRRAYVLPASVWIFQENLIPGIPRVPGYRCLVPPEEPYLGDLWWHGSLRGGWQPVTMKEINLFLLWKYKEENDTLVMFAYQACLRPLRSL